MSDQTLEFFGRNYKVGHQRMLSTEIFRKLLDKVPHQRLLKVQGMGNDDGHTAALAKEQRRLNMRKY